MEFFSNNPIVFLDTFRGTDKRGIIREQAVMDREFSCSLSFFIPRRSQCPILKSSSNPLLFPIQSYAMHVLKTDIITTSLPIVCRYKIVALVFGV